MFKTRIYIVFIESIILVVGVLVGVAFLTLLERKVLGYIQIRLGPNKVGFIGVIQPFRDAIKLFTKEQICPFLSNLYIYLFSPVFRLFFSLLLWVITPYLRGLIRFEIRILFFLCISRLRVYTIMMSGWSSNRNYSLLGGLRVIAQFISYEVRLFLILLSFLLIIIRLNLFDFIKYQNLIWLIWICIPLVFIWLVTRLAETNRTPFDFIEGESELVSGFNIEYRRGGFILLFLSEYVSILFIRIICVILFLGGNILEWSFYFKLIIVSFFWIWARGTIPRYRYDKLIMLCWKVFLPVSLNYLFFYCGLKILVGWFF
jgi:NADH:ubiquinone oxidoreductase subunit 1 (chain H)